MKKLVYALLNLRLESLNVGIYAIAPLAWFASPTLKILLIDFNLSKLFMPSPEGSEAAREC